MRKLAVVFLALLILATAAGCTGSEAPEAVQEYYTQFLDTVKAEPWSVATGQYCHFEEEWVRDMCAEVEERVVGYEIIEWEQLSDCLWAVQGDFETESDVVGGTCYHFVGQIDGRYYVMINARQIPEEMKEGLDMERFAPTGEVLDVDDVRVQ